MSFDYIAAIDVVMADCTIVRTLRTRIALLWPSVGMTLIETVRIRWYLITNHQQLAEYTPAQARTMAFPQRLLS